MEKIGIEEVHKRVLCIAKEFDRICTEHSIPYYMLYGTMLGAIRHKGFIPWDDDMDFGVPIWSYDKMLLFLSTELKYPYRACTFKNHPGCGTAFVKIEDQSTIIDDPRRHHISLDNQLGINIDIFPLCKCNKDDNQIKKFNRIKSYYSRVFVGNAQRNRWKNNIKEVLRFFAPHPPLWYLEKEMDILKHLEEGPFLASLFGIYGNREFMPLDVFGKGRRYIFEDVSLIGPTDGHQYLTQLYGDYYKLPPENKRIVHVNNVYIR